MEIAGVFVPADVLQKIFQQLPQESSKDTWNQLETKINNRLIIHYQSPQVDANIFCIRLVCKTWDRIFAGDRSYNIWGELNDDDDPEPNCYNNFIKHHLPDLRFNSKCYKQQKLIKMKQKIVKMQKDIDETQERIDMLTKIGKRRKISFKYEDWNKD